MHAEHAAGEGQILTRKARPGERRRRQIAAAHVLDRPDLEMSGMVRPVNRRLFEGEVVSPNDIEVRFQPFGRKAAAGEEVERGGFCG